MLSSDVVDGFASLFAGRLEAYGSEEGESIKTPDWTYIGYRSRVQLHLEADNPMGVYPLIPDSGLGWVVNWGCVDFDEGDDPSLIHAMNLRAVLAEFGIVGWIERSRSKGFHVWVFARHPIAAATMRRALFVACQIAKAPTKEVNPKSEGFFHDDGRMNMTKFGNYVRLPYPHGATDRRVVLDTDNTPLTVEWFVRIASQHRIVADDLVPLTALYVEPKPLRPRKIWAEHEVDENGLPSDLYMKRRTQALYRLGPFESNPDRSAALWRLANMLREDGYNEIETVKFLKVADARWGKFTARGDEERLHELVDKVFARD